MTSPYLKIYGERNTGTTYLQALIQQNLHATPLRGTAPRRWRRLARGREWPIDLYFRLTFPRNLGWKHRMAPTQDQLARIRIPLDQLHFLIIVKNPYAWLLSLYRRPYHYQGALTDFDTFLTSPWPTVGREHHPEPFPNPMALWNAKYASYLRLLTQHSGQVLRYEDLLADPQETLTQVADTLGIRQQPQFQNIHTSVKGDDHQRFEDYQRYYLEEAWRQALTPAQLATINRHLDFSLMQTLGYEPISA